MQKAKDNLEAARLLEQQGYYEIAASRAYYVMFYLAEALLQKLGLSFSSHSAVIAAFGKEFAKTGDLNPRFHQYLIKAQELRQTGDYGLQEKVSAESVRHVLGWADEFLTAAAANLNIDLP